VRQSLRGPRGVGFAHYLQDAALAFLEEVAPRFGESAETTALAKSVLEVRGGGGGLVV